MSDLLIQPENTFVLLIGSPEYLDDRWLQLPQINNNIEALRKIFSDKDYFGINKNSIEDVVGFSSNKAFAKIQSYLQPRKMRNVVSLIIYFSGHGLPHPYVGKKKDLQLIFKDTPKDFTESVPYAIRFSQIVELLNQLKFIPQKFIILDCCQSGIANDNDQLGINAPLDLDLEVEGNVIITAASDNGPAYVRDNEFTDFTGELIKLIRYGLKLHPYQIIDFLTAKKHFQDLFSKKILLSEPILNNKLTDKKTKESENFNFFFNSQFTLKCVENQLNDESKKAFKNGLELFKNILGTPDYKLKESEKDMGKINELSMLIFDREFEEELGNDTNTN